MNLSVNGIRKQADRVVRGRRHGHDRQLPVADWPPPACGCRGDNTAPRGHQSAGIARASSVLFFHLRRAAAHGFLPPGHRRQRAIENWPPARCCKAHLGGRYPTAAYRTVPNLGAFAGRRSVRRRKRRSGSAPHRVRPAARQRYLSGDGLRDGVGTGAAGRRTAGCPSCSSPRLLGEGRSRRQRDWYPAHQGCGARRRSVSPRTHQPTPGASR